MKKYITVLLNAQKTEYIERELEEMMYEKNESRSGNDLIALQTTSKDVLCKGTYYRTNVNTESIECKTKYRKGYICKIKGFKQECVITENTDTFLFVSAMSTWMDYGKLFIKREIVLHEDGTSTKEDSGRWFKCKTRFLNNATSKNKVEAREASLIEILKDETNIIEDR